MDDIEHIEFIHSQLATARSCLERASSLDPEVARAEREAARVAYDSVLQLLPRLQLLGKERVKLVGELSALADLLRAAGEEI